jgi:hypothetical protein
LITKERNEKMVIREKEACEIWTPQISKFVTTEPKKIITIKNKLVNIVI